MKTIPAHRNNFYPGRLSRPRVIVVHSGETPEQSNSAEAMANWFADPRAKASAHVCADVDGLVRSVADRDTAWAAPGCNSDGLQLELAGRAAQSTAQWQDAASDRILSNGARQMAAWHERWNIPLRQLSDAQLAAGQARGVVTHAQVSRVFHRSDHTDPGRFFPMADFLALASERQGQASDVIATPGPSADVPKFLYPVQQGNRGAMVKAVQRQLRSRGWRVTVDGVFGPRTDEVVRLFQKQKGLTSDGIVDRQTWRELWLAPVTTG